MEYDNLPYLNVLNQVGLNPGNFFKLLKLFNYDPFLFWKAPASRLKKYNIPNTALNNFTLVKEKLNPAKEFEKLLKKKITAVPHPALSNNTLYPKLLTHISDPPPLLYVMGDPLLLNNHYSVAIVGSRKVSDYGKLVTEKLAYQLAVNNVLVVSGLATGVDSVAHKATLQARKPTITVLAHGLDIVYPRSNTKLVQQILSQQGAVISEFPLGARPLKHHFPQRNRIISGISNATIITEAALKSGSLTTARHALCQNRDVFAVPGQIFSSTSAGTNRLIFEGAIPIISIQNLLETLNLPVRPTYDTKEDVTFSNHLHSSIYKSLSANKSMLTDELFKKISAPVNEINSALTVMELQGFIRNIGGGQYVKTF